MYGLVEQVYKGSVQRVWEDLSDIIQITKTPKILRYESDNLKLKQYSKWYLSDSVAEYRDSLPKKMQDNYGMVLNQIQSRLIE